jgi:hypothetical protein
MAQTELNDAAFARPAYYQENSGELYYAQEGLTKREYFAAMALQGIMAKDSPYAIDIRAYIAVEAAD